MSGSKKQGAGLQQDLEKTTSTVQRNGRLRGFEAKMRHFAFALEQGNRGHSIWQIKSSTQ